MKGVARMTCCSKDYATVGDIIATWRPLKDNEIEKAERLITQVSAEIRITANRYGKNIDDLIALNSDYALVVQSVVCDTVARVLNQSSDSDMFTQFSQSAGGYTISGTYANPGGGTLLLNRDLRKLGLKVQQFGIVDIYGTKRN